EPGHRLPRGNTREARGDRGQPPPLIVARRQAHFSREKSADFRQKYSIPRSHLLPSPRDRDIGISPDPKKSLFSRCSTAAGGSVHDHSRLALPGAAPAHQALLPLPLPK
uniref:Uncharacterized protein n=1 Tax=Aegilops tauschii subsp. strangulata TaxID=200361 RepID=A0A453GSP0_AEGTS